MLLLLRAFERDSRGAWAVFGLAFSAVLVWHPVSGFLVLPAYAVFICSVATACCRTASSPL